MPRSAPLLVLALLAAATVALPVLARAQANDPLTSNEADQVRDTAGSLDRRVPLLLQFAQARLTDFEKIRTASPRPPDRETELYELLRQYKAILPEADSAMDDLTQGVVTSDSHAKPKVPKVLDAAIAAEQRLTIALHHIQTASSPADLATYHFMLQDCLDVTSDSLQNAQEDRAQAGKKPAPGS